MDLARQQHLAYLRQQGVSSLARSVQHLVQQDLDQAQQRRAAQLQAALAAHLVQPRQQK